MAARFPGMNPYIELSEDLWTGFHDVLIADISKQLNATLPQNYTAFVEKRIELVEMPDQPLRQRKPDVAVARDFESDQGGGTATAVLPDIEPAALTLPDYDENPEAYIDIRTFPDRELVTSIEILSPSNKSPSGHGEYWTKRASMILQGVHLVEIDLLLQGRRLPAIEPLPPGDFYAFVSRGNRRPRCEVYGWSIRRPLPKLPIPLKAPDPDVILDLAQAVETTFNGGRFEQNLLYEMPIPASLSESDRAWVAERLPQSKKTAPTKA
jgi:hypothetical protein